MKHIITLIAVACIVMPGLKTFGQNKSRQYFLVCVNQPDLESISEKLDSAFHYNGFISAKTEAKSNCIKITSEKGTQIEDVKAVLSKFKLVITSYSQEYTSVSPLIFK